MCKYRIILFDNHYKKDDFDCGIKVASLLEKIAKKLPLYPVPVSLLGRLALSKNYQGKGIGKLLLIDAIKRFIKASQNIAIYALVVDGKNEEAKNFILGMDLWKLLMIIIAFFCL